MPFPLPLIFLAHTTWLPGMLADVHEPLIDKEVEFNVPSISVLKIKERNFKEIEGYTIDIEESKYLWVFRNGLIMTETEDFIVQGTSLIFAIPLITSDLVKIVYFK